MRPNLSSAASQSRTIVAAFVLGTAFASGGAQAAPAAGQAEPSADAIRDLTRYCQACWRNARIPPDRWADCTQQVFTRLLETVDRGAWPELLVDDASDNRRELIRAIDAVKKRTQRARKFADLSPDYADPRRVDDVQQDRRERLESAAQAVLSGRQQKIVELSATGWAVPEIAVELGTTPERVSDEKYKAIRKLRAHLMVD